MTKTDLISVVAEKAELKKSVAEKAVNAVIDSITSALVEGDKVQLIGFGTFEVRDRKERNAKNPQTGESMVIPAQKSPAFKAGAKLKTAVQK
ncbi:MAG: HU family DNA-binding protein [Oscillospiraceae bacterium]|jgi:DNA-binding protein HU-beta|nr:HU family DNA-binding protein [Oscillospiraceae bacterium]